MRKRLSAAALALLVLIELRCSDRYWVKRASAAYVVAEARYEAQCPVKSKCPNWELRQAALRVQKADIDAAIRSVEIAKLPKETRDLMKLYASQPVPK